MTADHTKHYKPKEPKLPYSDAAISPETIRQTVKKTMPDNGMDSFASAMRGLIIVR